MFETLRRSRLAVEKDALAGLEYHFDERCAVITLDRDMVEKNNASDDESSIVYCNLEEFYGDEIKIQTYGSATVKVTRQDSDDDCNIFEGVVYEVGTK